MDFLVHKLIDSSQAKNCIESIQEDQSLWESGKKTAGSYASLVKNNLQLKRDSEIALRNSTVVSKAIRSNELIKSFTLARKVHGIMFTKSSVGQGYGMHIDNAYMSSGRSDLSFTLFLSDPKDYEGG